VLTTSAGVGIFARYLIDAAGRAAWSAPSRSRIIDGFVALAGDGVFLAVFAVGAIGQLGPPWCFSPWRSRRRILHRPAARSPPMRWPRGFFPDLVRAPRRLGRSGSDGRLDSSALIVARCDRQMEHGLLCRRVGSPTVRFACRVFPGRLAAGRKQQGSADQRPHRSRRLRPSTTRSLAIMQKAMATEGGRYRMRNTDNKSASRVIARNDADAATVGGIRVSAGRSVRLRVGRVLPSVWVLIHHTRLD